MYNLDELEIVDAIESGNAETQDFDNDALQNMASQTLEYLHTKKQISINLKQSDLDFVKQRAMDIGIPYQSIIQTLVHNYSHNKINIKI